MSKKQENYTDTVTVDCRTLPCPQPIIRLKHLLTDAPPAHILVLVDNEPALENVNRFFASQGYAAEHTAEPGLWRITASREPGGESFKASAPAAARKGAEIEAENDGGKLLVLLASSVFGSGDDDLGGKLMKNFLTTLPECEKSLWRIVLLNSGVKLTVENSPVIDELRALERSGISILVCGACLNHFGLLEKKVVGQTTNMLDVVTSMQVADKIISLT